MTRIKFVDKKHEWFYTNMMREVGKNDSYHRALFYTLGISGDTRNHLRDLYDFVEDCIKPEGLYVSWQTGGSRRVTRLAFNLWNGWVEEKGESLSTPYNLFDCDHGVYFLEALRLKYPDYCLKDKWRGEPAEERVGR